MVEIRQALPEDAHYVMDLIKLLAEYEKMPDQVKLDEETLTKDIKRDAVRVKLCFFQDKLAGMALYFYVYSSWEGQVHIVLFFLFLEVPTC